MHNNIKKRKNHNNYKIQTIPKRKLLFILLKSNFFLIYKALSFRLIYNKI